MSTDVVRHAPMAVTDRARAQWDAGQIELIKWTIMPENSNDGELALFLEAAARYELDPFTNQIWAVRFQGKVRNVVAAAGWLQIADRRPDFRGCQSFEIREHDYFDRTIEDGHVIVEHRMRDADGNPTHGGRDGKLRGEIIGGFAYVRREGHIDTQFLAYMGQYDKSGEPKHNSWKSHPTAMAQKVAEAMALRKAYPLAGIYSEYEVPADREPTNLTRPGNPMPIDFGPDETLAAELEDAFKDAGYTRAKVRMTMNGCADEDARRKVLEDLRAEVALSGPVIDGEALDDTAAA